MRHAVAGLLLMLAACNDQPPVVIDGSSPEAFERTTKAARSDIPDADRLIFDRAINTVSGRRYANTIHTAWPERRSTA
jgi:hypothetical protein